MISFLRIFVFHHPRESEIRKWIIENDLLECIVQLPDQMFFNTGITTYFWIVTNKKSEKRKGKVQLIDGSSFYENMRKPLGDKRKLMNHKHHQILFDTYKNFEETSVSQIKNNDFFGYTKVVVEQPLKENDNVVTNKKGELKPDSSKRDNERVPLIDDINEYFDREVKPHLKDSWMDRSKDKIGYEINFTKYFYKFTNLRNPEKIREELYLLDKEINEISKTL